MEEKSFKVVSDLSNVKDAEVLYKLVIQSELRLMMVDM